MLSCPGGELSQRGIVLVWSCYEGELSWWGVIRWWEVLRTGRVQWASAQFEILNGCFGPALDPKPCLLAC